MMILLLASCSKEENSNNPADPFATAQTNLNVAYGNLPNQNLDAYLPAGRSTAQTKVMILIHGGAWVSGDKADFNTFIDSLKKREPNYAIFNLNYRLSATPSNLFPTQENDVKAALDFIFNKAQTYGISNNWVLMGASAGGHLALLQGYKYSSPIKPKAVVSFFGPTDLTDMYNNPVNGQTLISISLATAIGSTPTQNPAIYQSSSPVNFVTAACPPTLFLHGGLDPLVSPTQSTNLQQLLTTAGVPAQYVFYPNGGHGDWDGPTYTDAFNRIQTFLHTYVP